MGGAMSCPTCGKEFPATASGALPFCSDRCRLIDLKRWLGEEHGLPLAGGGEDEWA